MSFNQITGRLRQLVRHVEQVEKDKARLGFAALPCRINPTSSSTQSAPSARSPEQRRRGRGYARSLSGAAGQLPVDVQHPHRCREAIPAKASGDHSDSLSETAAQTGLIFPSRAAASSEISAAAAGGKRLFSMDFRTARPKPAASMYAPAPKGIDVCNGRGQRLRHVPAKKIDVVGSKRAEPPDAPDNGIRNLACAPARAHELSGRALRACDRSDSGGTAHYADAAAG